MIFGILFLFGHYGDVPLSTLDDPAADRGARGGLRRCCRCSAEPAPGQDLVPAVDALLRRQLGDHAVAVPQGERGGGEARHPASRSRRGSSSSRSATSTTARWREYLLNKGLAFRAMHSHGRALNALLPARGRRRRGLRRPRGRADLERRQRLELRRRALPRRASCSRRSRSAAGSSRGDVRVICSSPSRRPAGRGTALRDLRRRRLACSRRARSRSRTWSTASRGSTSPSTSRSRSRAAPPGARRPCRLGARSRLDTRRVVERGDRRRLRPQRARLRGRPRARRASQVTVLEAEDGDRRGHPEQRADGARAAARRLLGRAPDGGRSRRSCARSDLERHGLEWLVARGRSARIRSTTAAPG